MKTLGVMNIHVPPQVFQQIAQAYRRRLQQRSLSTQAATTIPASHSSPQPRGFRLKEEEGESSLFSKDRDDLEMKRRMMNEKLRSDYVCHSRSFKRTALLPQASHTSPTQDSFRASQDWSEDKSGVRVLPNGSMFVSRRVRRGIFPQVLSDILQTRIMVKQAMKKYKGKKKPSVSETTSAPYSCIYVDR